MGQAVRIHSQLRESTSGWGDSMQVRLQGPVDESLDAFDDRSKRLFKSGVMFSQTLDSYYSDRGPQYGLASAHRDSAVPGGGGGGGEEEHFLYSFPSSGEVRSKNKKKSPYAGRKSHRAAEMLVDPSVASTQSVYSYTPGSDSLDAFPASVPVSSTSLSSSSAVYSYSSVAPGSAYSSSATSSVLSKNSASLPKSRPEDACTVFVTWGDWMYYSTELWNVGSVFVCYAAEDGEAPHTSSERKRRYLRISSNAIGNRRYLLRVHSIGV